MRTPGWATSVGKGFPDRPQDLGDFMQAMATLDVYDAEGLFERAAALESYWEDAAHALRGLPHVIDLRNLGLVAAVELETREGQPGARGFEAFTECFAEGALIRATGDVIALSPPLVCESAHIDELFGVLGRVLRRIA